MAQELAVAPSSMICLNARRPLSMKRAVKHHKIHAEELGPLINLVGKGIPEHLWQGLVEDGRTPMKAVNTKHEHIRSCTTAND